MSKILVVQPYQMLQHAIRVSLFPQHQARVTSAIPQLSDIGDVDAAIIDAAALRETETLSGEAVRLLQDWKIPIVWIDSVDSPVKPGKSKCVQVNTPIARHTLQTALAECLDELPRSARNKTRPGNREKPSSDEEASRQASVTRQIIDLVEVVEEGFGSHEGDGQEQL